MSVSIYISIYRVPLFGPLITWQAIRVFMMRIVNMVIMVVIRIYFYYDMPVSEKQF